MTYEAWKQKKYFCLRLEGHWRKEQDPYPLVRGTDPQIRIRTKMSRIRNTSCKSEKENFQIFFQYCLPVRLVKILQGKINIISVIKGKIWQFPVLNFCQKCSASKKFNRIRLISNPDPLTCWLPGACWIPRSDCLQDMEAMSSHGAECHAPQAAAANSSSLDQAGQGLFMIKFLNRFTCGKVFWSKTVTYQYCMSS